MATFTVSTPRNGNHKMEAPSGTQARLRVAGFPEIRDMYPNLTKSQISQIFSARLIGTNNNGGRPKKYRGY